MKIWTNNEFNGVWPVGTAAVVIADSAEEAAEWFRLIHPEFKVFPYQFKEMPMVDGQVRLLADGDY